MNAPLVVTRPDLVAALELGEPEACFGPTAMLVGPLEPLGILNWVRTPVVVIRPIWPVPFSAIQSAPSGPETIPSGDWLFLPVGSSGNSVMTPVVVIRPILPSETSVNQSAPSEPTVIPYGVALFGIANSVIDPLGVIRPILPDWSANQRFPSGPVDPH